MEKVSVAIASIGRETLIDTVKSLAALPHLDGTELTVLIADDSKDSAAAKLLSHLSFPNLSTTCLQVASGNISTARNALLDAATGDWIIFVDDDEWVDAAWLEKLFSCQSDYCADVVIGPVRPVYPDGTPDWFVKANPLYHDWGHRGKPLTTGRGGNTLVRMDFVREHHLRFDEAFGVTGGEDTAFFAEAHIKGAKIFATDDAIAYEHVPNERLSSSYIFSRAVRSGQSYGKMQLEIAAGLIGRIVFSVDALVKCAVSAGLTVFTRCFDRSASFRMKQKFALNLGKLRAVLGLPLAELYKHPD
jgi:succinoglycan biosynthesis protein ExoM